MKESFGKEQVLLQKLTSSLLVEAGNDYLKLIVITDANSSATEVKEWKVSSEQKIFDLLQLPEVRSFFSSGFKNVIVAFNNNEYSLVPHVFADKNTDEMDFRTYMQPSNTKQLRQTLQSIPASIVFDANEQLLQVFDNLAPNVYYTHSAAILADSFVPNTETKNTAYIYWFNSNLLIALSLQNKLVLLNSFKASKLNDAAYYLFNALEQSNFSVKETQLYYSCKPEESGELTEMLSRYIFTIAPLNPLVDKLKNSNHCAHTLLYNQLLCV